MHEDQRGGGRELDGEIAIGHRVERVFAERLEAEFLRHALAVNRKRGAGQRRGAQRQAVDAPPAVGKALPVALEHLEVGEQVVSEGDRLGHLHVREARHYQRRVLFCAASSRFACRRASALRIASISSRR